MIQQKLNFTPDANRILLEKTSKNGNTSSIKVIDLNVLKIKKRSLDSSDNNTEPKKRKITKQSTLKVSSAKNQSLLTSWVLESQSSLASKQIKLIEKKNISINLKKTSNYAITSIITSKKIEAKKDELSLNNNFNLNKPKGINKGWGKIHLVLNQHYFPSDQKNDKVKASKKTIIKQRNSLKDKCKIKHISDSVQHFELLQKIFTIAKDHLLITSHTVSWLPEDIYELFLDAVDRGIKINVIYNTDIDPRIEEFFENNGIRYEQNSIHAKYLIVDKKQFVVGSYNWLDFRNIDDSSIGESGDRSFKISKNEKYVHQLRGKVWSEIISHREEPSEKKGDFKKLSISGDSSNLTLLTTLFDHEDFLLKACRDAKRKIEIHSPFVTYANATKRLSDIAKILSNNVRIDLYVGEGLDKLKGFIKNHSVLINNTHIYLDDFHRKTLIIDDELISEGSFNWLSSSNSLASEFHNHDASLVVKGPISRDMIEIDSVKQNI
ncbi:MAG: hypothetical protein H0V82_03180 [Candidatus Protochlamydia sp.]|nr:hypothetical protein [Candidatus Protochlamydia sp.]